MNQILGYNHDYLIAIFIFIFFFVENAVWSLLKAVKNIKVHKITFMFSFKSKTTFGNLLLKVLIQHAIFVSWNAYGFI